MLHIINGDGAGNCLLESEVSGEVLVCRDLLYDGTRNPGWPDNASLQSRAQFLAQLTGGALVSEEIQKMLESHYRKLSKASEYNNIVLWFDACLCDQSMLAHTLVCLKHLGLNQAELLCIDTFPGISPFNGLGQLQPSQLASLFNKRNKITSQQFEFAHIVEKALATQDLTLLRKLSLEINAPLPHVPAAVTRWLQEQPDAKTGLGRLEHLILKALREGYKTPGEILSNVTNAEESPQFWGDTILWQKINALAEKKPPLVHIVGPTEKLPQWTSPFDLNRFKIEITSNSTR